MQRRVEQADRDGRPVHDLEEPLEVGLLKLQQLAECDVPGRPRTGHDHRAHLWMPVGGHEHVLGPAQPDALGAEFARSARIRRCVGVRAHAERPHLVAPLEHRRESLVHLRLHERNVIERHVTAGAVDCDRIARVQDRVTDPDLARV